MVTALAQYPAEIVTQNQSVIKCGSPGATLLEMADQIEEMMLIEKKKRERKRRKRGKRKREKKGKERGKVWQRGKNDKRKGQRGREKEQNQGKREKMN